MKAIRIVIPLLLSLCAALPLHAQQRTLDSLTRLVRTLPESDTSHARALISLSQLCKDDEPDRARTYLDAALRVSKRNGDKRGVAVASLGIGMYHIKRHQLDSAQWYVEHGLAIYEEIRWAMGCANAHNFLGEIYGKRGQQRKAIAEFRLAAGMYGQLGREDRAGGSLANIGIMYHDQSIYDSAATYFAQALHLFTELGDRRGMALQYMNLANVQENFHKSIEYFQKSMELSQEVGDTYTAYMARYNLGLTLSRTDQKEAARCMLEKVVQESETFHDPEMLCGALSGLGNVYRAEGNAARAMDCYQRGIVLAEHAGLTKMAAKLYADLAHASLEAKDYDQAGRFAETALAAARKINHRRNEQYALLLLSEIREATGDPSAALGHYKAAYVLRDSIFSDEGTKRIMELNARWDADRRESDIRVLEAGRALQNAELGRRSAELARQRLEILERSQRIALLDRQHEIDRLESGRMQSELTLQKEISVRHQRDASLLAKDKELQSSVVSRATLARNAAFAAIGGLFVIGFLVQRRVRESRRAAELRAEATDAKARLAEARAAALEAEKERREKDAQRELTRRLIESQERTHRRIAGDLHDGLGQGLLVMKNGAWMALQAQVLPGDVRENLLAVSEAADASLSDLRRIVRDLRPTQLDRFGLRETLRSMLQQLNDTTDVRFTGSVDEIDDAFPDGSDINVYRIVQEATNNIIKHARAREAGVHVTRSGGEVRIDISDDGCGFDAASVASCAVSAQGFGLQGIAERARILGGSMTIESSPGTGTRLSVRIPVRHIGEQKTEHAITAISA